MLKIENRLFFIFAFSMALVVSLSNYLVQFPVKYLGLENLLTYGAFSYPVAFLITDLSNRRYGKSKTKKIVYLGFALGVFIAASPFKSESIWPTSHGEPILALPIITPSALVIFRHSIAS